jgi:superfamily I DNA/RNA helicase
MPEDWTFLHSLGLAGHDLKLWAEIDYVAIGPTGIYCLEVKGGRLAREDGVWRFTNRFDVTTEKREGPFEQVGSATAALRAYLRKHAADSRQAPIGFGVMTPSIPFGIEGPDVDPEVVFDQEDLSRPMPRYFDRLTEVWASRFEQRRGHRPKPLTPRQRAQVVDVLRPDFDLRPSLRARVGIARDELIRLTAEQSSILRRLDSNARVLVQGGAGSGKTMLGVEEATRASDAGKRVLYCCFNRRLAAFVRQVIGEREHVDVSTLHSLMAHTVTEAGLDARLPDAEPGDLFKVCYPELCLEALVALERLEAYDVLVIDEAQDLLSEAYLEVFDAILEHGLAGGCWRMFLDPNQNLFEGIESAGMAKVLALQPTRFPLTVNCRNTTQIAVNTALFAGVPVEETLVDGPEVEFHWYKDDRDQRKLLSNHLNRLLSAGIGADDIVILSPRQREHGCLATNLEELVGAPIRSEDDGGGNGARAMSFSTISSFKGLEADAVALVDLDDIASDRSRYALYVGTSRARVLLAVFIAETQREVYTDRAGEFGRELRDTAERSRGQVSA